MTTVSTSYLLRYNAKYLYIDSSTLVECVSATETSLLPNHHVVDFVDRPSYMNQLRAFFGGDRKPQMRFVLHGMGGVGYVSLVAKQSENVNGVLETYHVLCDLCGSAMLLELSQHIEIPAYSLSSLWIVSDRANLSYF